jgi:hypothetical protein
VCGWDRECAKTTAELAETDDLDADLLALVADRVPPTPTAPRRGWDALMTRRHGLSVTEMLPHEHYTPPSSRTASSFRSANR